MNDIIKTYKQLVISKKIVIVYFFNEECIKTNNIYNNLKNNNKNVLFLDYDVEKKDNQKLINIIDLKCYPYFFVYKNGKLIDQILGTLNVEKILGQYVCT
jgi:thiol-disulfide isomerase/thioredoxin